MSVFHPVYERLYGYPWRIAVVAEFWWRVEHVGYYRGGDGGLFGHVRRLAYRQRKAWERRGAEAKRQRNVNLDKFDPEKGA